jgi:hypothetical protein
MGDRRQKKRVKAAAEPSRPDVFAEYRLNAAEFDVDWGKGQGAITKQHIVYMHIRHIPSGRVVSGKIGTTKKGAESQRDKLLRTLLQSFRRR